MVAGTKCLEYVQKGRSGQCEATYSPPRVEEDSRGPNHAVPYGTDSQLDQFPGNKPPGYDRLVPPGQSPTSPEGTN
jgi:hypothetical protein